MLACPHCGVLHEPVWDDECLACPHCLYIDMPLEFVLAKLVVEQQQARILRFRGYSEAGNWKQMAAEFYHIPIGAIAKSHVDQIKSYYFARRGVV